MMKACIANNVTDIIMVSETAGHPSKVVESFYLLKPFLIEHTPVAINICVYIFGGKGRFIW